MSWAESKKSGFEILRPLRMSEFELWMDLYLARALLAASPRTLSRSPLVDVEQRFRSGLRKESPIVDMAAPQL